MVQGSNEPIQTKSQSFCHIFFIIHIVHLICVFCVCLRFYFGFPHALWCRNRDMGMESVVKRTVSAHWWGWNARWVEMLNVEKKGWRQSKRCMWDAHMSTNKIPFSGAACCESRCLSGCFGVSLRTGFSLQHVSAIHSLKCCGHN